MTRAIWWVRRDLRLHDNPALQESLQSASDVIPIFIVDSTLIKSPNTSKTRLAFLYQGLEQLHKDLTSLGSRLILRSGSPVPILTEILQESRAETIYAESDFSPYARRRDNAVGENLPLVLTGNSSFSHPHAVLKSDGTPYTVFTPYMRSWKGFHALENIRLIPPPQRISTPQDISSEPFPEINIQEAYHQDFSPGETNALKHLNQFTAGKEAPIYDYTSLRDRVDLRGTSQLSPYLHFGMLSPQMAIKSAYEAISQAPDDHSRQGAETWLNELIWRDFYIAILNHFPHVLQHSFRPEYRDIPWQNDEEDFSAWCEGSTGYPIVDAAMHQLAETGWMHNRARMITASFLVKDLLVDWRWGERWFMQNLVDGDLASNNGGWQWTAGTGTDAAPYFRIFNPTLQGVKHDPEGTYIRRWLPQLADVPQKYIHTPWEMPDNIQVQASCQIGKHYPLPIIDHGFARQRTVEAYKSVK